MTAAAMPAAAATPAMVPPTIAPVFSFPLLLPPPLVEGAEAFVGVLDDDDESLVAVESTVVVGEGMVTVVRDDVWVDDAVSPLLSEAPVAVALEADAVELESEVARLLGLCVRLTLTLASCTSDETPVASSDTVAARSLAVPQPHCE